MCCNLQMYKRVRFVQGVSYFLAFPHRLPCTALTLVLASDPGLAGAIGFLGGTSTGLNPLATVVMSVGRLGNGYAAVADLCAELLFWVEAKGFFITGRAGGSQWSTVGWEDGIRVGGLHSFRSAVALSSCRPFWPPSSMRGANVWSWSTSGAMLLSP